MDWAGESKEDPLVRAVHQWQLHVISDGNNKMPYHDMIIGRDLMKSLNMDMLYSEHVIVWDLLRLPMQEINTYFRSTGDFNALV